MFAKTIQIPILELLLFSFFVSASASECLLRKTAYGSVCVCTASHCDYIKNPEPILNEIAVISSSQAGQRFAVSSLHFGKYKTSAIMKTSTNREHAPFSKCGLNDDTDLSVDRSVEYQNIIGFGGSLTGAVSHLLGLLQPKLQDHIYKSYYHKDGNGFNLVRMPIGGCDFDLAMWAYNEEPENDIQLSNFKKLDQRDEIKVKQLKRLKFISKLHELKIKADAWSPPRWMKSNGNWTGVSSLKAEYYKTWADYHLRFFDLMHRMGLPIWATSTGNEPLSGNILAHYTPVPSLGWLPGDHAIWLNDYFGPIIRDSIHKDVFIFGIEDRRVAYPYWLYEYNSTRPGAIDYLDGFSVHWYADNFIPSSVMNLSLQEFPGKIVINGESCITDAPQLGSWERGEKYARDFLDNLKHNYSGWLDWNMILDEQGGPNWLPGFVDAPIIVNTTNRAEIYKQPIFYAMGHFSKFVPEGSVRIDANIFSTSAVEAIAFKRPDERVVVVILNSDKMAADVLLIDSVQGEVKVKLPAKSWHTIIYN